MLESHEDSARDHVKSESRLSEEENSTSFINIMINDIIARAIILKFCRTLIIINDQLIAKSN
jgi:hypothetical protein